MSEFVDIWITEINKPTVNTVKLIRDLSGNGLEYAHKLVQDVCTFKKPRSIITTIEKVGDVVADLENNGITVDLQKPPIKNLCQEEELSILSIFVCSCEEITKGKPKPIGFDTLMHKSLEIICRRELERNKIC